MNCGIQKKLLNSEIYLYGISEKTKEFYLEYRDMLNIKACVTNYYEMKKSRLLDDYGINTILLEEFEYTGNEYLIVCDEQLYDYDVCFFTVAEEALSHHNISEYEQYISYLAVNALLKNRKIALIQGTLLCEQIYWTLKHQSSVSDYEFIYYDEDRILTPYSNYYREYLHIGQISDLYIYSVCDKERYSIKVLNDAQLKMGCVRIGVSDYRFNALYPQIEKVREKYSTFLFRKRERVKENYARFILAREDSNLVSMILEDKTETEIKKRILSSDFYSVEELRRHFDNNIKRVAEADKISDIKLADYYQKNIHNELISANLDEYYEGVVNYICSEILHILDREYIENNVMKPKGTELLVYPSVAKFYGISDLTKNKQYCVHTYFGDAYMNEEDYLEYCIKAIKSEIKLINIMGIKGYSHNELAGRLQKKIMLYPTEDYFAGKYDAYSYYYIGNKSQRVATELVYLNIIESKVLAITPVISEKSIIFWGAQMSNNYYVTTDETSIDKLKEIIEKVNPKVIVTNRREENELKSIAGARKVIEINKCQNNDTIYQEILEMKLTYNDRMPFYVNAYIDSEGNYREKRILYSQILSGEIKVPECGV